jgi:hypothetical protein
MQWAGLAVQPDRRLLVYGAQVCGRAAKQDYSPSTGLMEYMPNRAGGRSSDAVQNMNKMATRTIAVDQVLQRVSRRLRKTAKRQFNAVTMTAYFCRKLCPSESAHIRTNKTPAPPMPNRLVRLLSEARWLALAVLAYLALILASYAKMDPAGRTAAGAAGAQLGGRVAPGCPTCCCTSSALGLVVGVLLLRWCGRAIAA